MDQKDRGVPVRKARFFAALLPLVALSACAPGSVFESEPTATPPAPKASSSPVIEDDTRLLAVSVGTVAGSQLGGNIGKRLSDTDRTRMQDATQRALETGKAGTAVRWTGTGGHTGSITPQPPFTSSGGITCREFQQTVTVDSENATAYGTACKQANGTWTVVSG